MKKITLLLCCFSFLITAAQTNIQLSPNKYNTIYDEGNLSNGQGGYFFTGRTGFNQNALRRGFLQFDLSSIPAGSTINSVTLNLYMSKSNVSTILVSLHSVSQDWGQGTSNASGEEGGGDVATNNDTTWACRFSDGLGGCTSSWTTVGGDFNSTASAVEVVSFSVGTYSWTSAGMVINVQDWLDNGSTNFGWIIIGDEESSTTAKRFNAITTNPPTLDINYTVPLSVSEVDYSKLKLSPNPTNDGKVTLKKTDQMLLNSLTIYSVLGKQIKTIGLSSMRSNIKRLELNQFATGVYLVKIISNKGVSIHRRLVIK